MQICALIGSTFSANQHRVVPVEIDMPVWLVMHEDLRVTKRVRLLFDFLKDQYKALLNPSRYPIEARCLKKAASYPRYSDATAPGSFYIIRARSMGDSQG
jgi:hypothetical protein